MGVNTLLRRQNSSGEEDRKQQLPIRMSGTKVATLTDINTNPAVGVGQLGPDNGREGNDVKTPDYDSFLINTVNGDRYQDIANSHLSEGPAPGRIPHRWNNLVKGILGKHITGAPNGDSGVYNANQGGGAEDQKYIPHIGIPRGVGLARAFMRTVDDAASIPAIYVADPTRR